MWADKEGYFQKLSQGSETSDMTSVGLAEMFERDSSDMCAGKFPLTLMGGRANGQACTDGERWGLSRGSSVRRPWSEDPNWRQRKFHIPITKKERRLNFYIILTSPEVTNTITYPTKNSFEPPLENNIFIFIRIIYSIKFEVLHNFI
jgi:hypothetical protein